MVTQADLKRRAQHRRDRYQTHEISKMFIPKDPVKQYIKGEYSLTQANGKLAQRERFILKNDNSIDYGEFCETPTSTARDFIHLSNLKPSRMRAGISYRDYVSTPDYAMPGAQFSDGAYLDIRAAYFSILNLVGWNCNYALGRWCFFGDAMTDFPFPENRIARNSLVTSAEKKTEMRRVVNGQIVVRPSWNELTNLHLVTAVSDVLHALANLAVEAGAVYVNTDGFIAPTAPISDKIAQYISDFGLTARVKEQGGGMVASMTNYRIGNKATIGFRAPKTALDPKSSICAMSTQKIIWLQKQLDFIAAKRQEVKL